MLNGIAIRKTFLKISSEIGQNRLISLTFMKNGKIKKSFEWRTTGLNENSDTNEL